MEFASEKGVNIISNGENAGFSFSLNVLEMLLSKGC